MSMRSAKITSRSVRHMLPKKSMRNANRQCKQEGNGAQETTKLKQHVCVIPSLGSRSLLGVYDELSPALCPLSSLKMAALAQILLRSQRSRSHFHSTNSPGCEL